MGCYCGTLKSAVHDGKSAEPGAGLQGTGICVGLLAGYLDILTLWLRLGKMQPDVRDFTLTLDHSDLRQGVCPSDWHLSRDMCCAGLDVSLRLNPVRSLTCITSLASPAIPGYHGLNISRSGHLEPAQSLHTASTFCFQSYSRRVLRSWYKIMPRRPFIRAFQVEFRTLRREVHHSRPE